MAQPPKIYIPGPLKYMWNYLSWKVADFKVYLQGYRCYKASLSQTGGDPPVATILENSLGINIDYIRAGGGTYIGMISESLFETPALSINGKKMDIFITPSAVVIGNSPIIFSAYPIFFNVLAVTSFNVTSGFFEDLLLGGQNPTTLEIRIYNK